MRNFLLLAKAQLKMHFRKDASGRSRSAATLVGFIVCGAILSAGIAVLCGLAGKTFAQYGFVTEMTALILAADFILTFAFGTVAILSYLYFSRDNEFLLGLPVGINSVFFSKLAVVYIEETIVGTLLGLPGLTVLGIASGQLPVFYLMIALSVLFLPVLALLVGGVISLPLMYIAGFFKNKGAAASVILILLFAAGMTVYVLVVNLAQPYSDAQPSSPEAVIEAAKNAVRTPLYIIYPVYCLARFGTAGQGLASAPALSMAIDLLIFLGAVALSAVIVVSISSLAYKRIVARQTENVSSSGVAKKEYSSSGVLKALIKKDWKELSRNPAFAFQCLAGTVIAPVFVVVFSVIIGVRVSDGTGDAVLPETVARMLSCLIFCVGIIMAQMMSVSTNICAMTAFTREGKNFIYDKIIPVPYAEQIKAKRVLSLIPAAISCVLSVIATVIVSVVLSGSVDVPSVLCASAMLALCALFTTDYSLYRDLKKPRFDWVTPKEAVKNFATTGVPTLVGMLFAILSSGAAIAIGIVFISNGLGASGAAIGYAAGAIMYLALWLAFRKKLNANATAFYERASV